MSSCRWVLFTRISFPRQVNTGNRFEKVTLRRPDSAHRQTGANVINRCGVGAAQPPRVALARAIRPIRRGVDPPEVWSAPSARSLPAGAGVLGLPRPCPGVGYGDGCHGVPFRLLSAAVVAPGRVEACVSHEVGDGGHVRALVEHLSGRRAPEHVRGKPPDARLLAAQFDASRYGPAGSGVALGRPERVEASRSARSRPPRCQARRSTPRTLARLAFAVAGL